ncbi:MAG: acyltransferase [Candidatus Gastranaerophilales bacterium]|nr:acyltransferase [Candidatus Gastranaerophilales bacterium]
MSIFGFNRRIKNCGKNNQIKIDKNIKCAVDVKGDNNIVDITAMKTPNPKKINLHIYGNNNRVIIKNLETGNITIDVGNYTGINNSEISIDDNFACVKMKILAYQHNTPIKIGKNCMFSSGISIRSGELPHVIYDLNTREDLDKSDGIFIGNHVWIGENASILKRVKIQDECVVGTMSVVTKAFDEKHVVIAGNPAKICKRNVLWGASAETVPDIKPEEVFENDK